MCILRGLFDSQPALNLDRIAYYYHEWFKSPPFDIGNTTSLAINPEPYDALTAALCRENVARWNVDSQSNGCMMR